ncbi:MAG: ATPase, T2SS/T4P/T4SS family, partial [Anaerolineae bacterium]|nr:ATPase, T2SS/T4P/T4SS family [Anaerolineae bacterium]
MRRNQKQINDVLTARAPQFSRQDSNQKDDYVRIRERVQRRLLAELSPVVDINNTASVRRALEQIFIETLNEEHIPMSRADRDILFEQIVADVLGLGPIQVLINDDSITEVLVNGPDLVYVERNGILEETDIRFRDTEEVMHVIDRIVTPLGRRVDESSPMVDAR